MHPSLPLPFSLNRTVLGLVFAFSSTLLLQATGESLSRVRCRHGLTSSAPLPHTTSCPSSQDLQHSLPSSATPTSTSHLVSSTRLTTYLHFTVQCAPSFPPPPLLPTPTSPLLPLPSPPPPPPRPSYLPGLQHQSHPTCFLLQCLHQYSMVSR